MNVATSRQNQNSQQPQHSSQALSSAPSTEHILSSIRAKLGLTSEPAVTSREHTRTSSSASNSQNGSMSAKNQHNVRESSATQSSTKRPINTLEDLSDDFSMNDIDFGSPKPRQNASHEAKPSNKAMDAVYKAYNGAKNYGNIINENPQPLSKKSQTNLEQFSDFEDYSSEKFDNFESQQESAEYENDDLGEFDIEAPVNTRRNAGYNNVKQNDYRRPEYSTANNVAHLQTRTENAQHSSNRNSLVAANRNAELVQNYNFNRSSSETVTTYIMHMVQQEVSSHILSWLSHNDSALAATFHQTCESLAMEWCQKNAMPMLEKSLDSWCNANLTNLCTQIIREELNKAHMDHKTA